MRQTTTTNTKVSKSVSPVKGPAKRLPAAAIKAEPKKPMKRAIVAKPAVGAKSAIATKPVTAGPVKAPRPRNSAHAKPEISNELHRCYVEVAAYFISERHGFAPGREHENWVEAEAEIDRMIAGGLLHREPSK